MAAASLVTVPESYNGVYVESGKFQFFSQVPATVLEPTLNSLSINKSILEMRFRVDVRVVILLQRWKQMRDNRASQRHQAIPVMVQ